MSRLGTVAFVGALLLSAAPVDAADVIETVDDLSEACSETIELMMLCQGLALYHNASIKVDVLCSLVKQDLITPVNAVKMWENYSGPALWNEAAKRRLEEHPNCPINSKSAAYSFKWGKGDKYVPYSLYQMTALYSSQKQR